MCGILPQVQPLCVLRKSFWYAGEVSERTVDLSDTWTAAAPGAGWDGVDRNDLEEV